MQDTIFEKSLLDLESLWVGKSDVVCVQKYIELLSKKLSLNNIHQSDPLQQLQYFRIVLFEQENFCSCKGLPCENFMLSKTLLEKNGSCLGFSTVYYVLATILALPLKPVLFEGHVAIVHRGNDSEKIYVETQSGNAANHSFLYLGMPPIKILESGEFLAVHLSNQATLVYARAGLLDDAVFLIDSALELFPDYTAGWINRAVLIKKIGNTKAMHQSLERAKSLHPGVRYTKAIEQIEKT